MFCSIDRINPPETAQYTVQVDDSFYKISKYYSINLDDLVDANPDTDPDYINEGDLLCIPISLQVISCPADSVVYTVKPGDTIYQLSKSFNIKIAALLKANSRINPDVLLPGQVIYIPKPWNKYCNNEYKIGFMYPTRWAKINNLHYEGVDGFFRISPFQSDKNLEDICKAEAYHKLKPYGSFPELIHTTAAGLKACIILPSDDQPMEMKKQAAMILKYTEELEIGSQKQNHMILWADKEHINDLKSSLIISV